MSERKLATIRKIDSILVHPNADLLELAIIGGWQCVVKKGEFKAGDLCVYFEIDSLLPVIPEFEFLRKSSYIKKDWLEPYFENGECFRLKTIRLRKEYSQGLIIPIPDEVINSYELYLGTEEESIGADVTEFFGVVKCEPPLNPSMQGKTAGNFPRIFS